MATTRWASSTRNQKPPLRPIDVARSRVMTCGNPSMSRDVRRVLAARGFAPVRRNTPGQMTFENYWQNPPGAERAPAAPGAITP